MNHNAVTGPVFLNEQLAHRPTEPRLSEFYCDELQLLACCKSQRFYMVATCESINANEQYLQADFEIVRSAKIAT